MREFMGGLILGGVAAMTGVGLAAELGAIVSAARVGYAAGAANATVAGTSAVSGGLGGAAMLGADAATPLVGSMLAEVSVGGATVAGVSAVSTNKLNHIFGNADHGLDGLVKATGSREAAFGAIQTAANSALAGGKLTVGPNGILPGGQAGAVLNVSGINVQLVGGRAINGTVEIGSASRKYLDE